MLAATFRECSGLSLLFTPRFTFDHAVVVVRNLDAAIRWCAASGLRAVPGGRHTDVPTHNALVPLPDGSYLEFLAPRLRVLPALLALAGRAGLLGTLQRGRAPLARRFLAHLSGEPGVADFAVAVRGIEAAVEAARTAGLEIEGPYRMGRRRPDGRALAWRLAVPANAELPFLIEDETAREDRVPGGEATRHPCGATGVASVTVAVADPARARAAYARLLARPDDEDRASALTIGATTIHLAPAPAGRTGALALAVAGMGSAPLSPQLASLRIGAA